MLLYQTTFIDFCGAGRVVKLAQFLNAADRIGAELRGERSLTASFNGPIAAKSIKSQLKCCRAANYKLEVNGLAYAQRPTIAAH